MLKSLPQNQIKNIDEYDESDSEKTMYVSEMSKLQEMYKNASDEWEEEKNSLLEQMENLKSETEKLKMQLEVYEQSAKILNEGEDEIRRAFVIKTREHAEAAGELLLANRKNVALRELLNRESRKSYQERKEAIRSENYLRKSLADAINRGKVLEREISTIQSNLSNSVSYTVYNDLKEKHEELAIRHRNLLENNLLLENAKETEISRSELEMVKREKEELLEHFRKEIQQEEEKDLKEELKESQAKELLERQRADHVSSLHEILQTQLSKCEENLREAIAAKSELQEELIVLHKRLSKDLRFEKNDQSDDNRVQELKDNIETLRIENEDLKKQLEIAREEAKEQYSLNSLKLMELDDLRHQILDLQAVSEDKATISRLDFELAGKKTSEMELNALKSRMENELSYQQEELEKLRTTCDGLRVYVQDCRKQCEGRCR